MASFSKRDITTLQEMARAFRATPATVQGRPKNRPPEPRIQMAPEVYVAKPQSAGGIPAAVGDTPGNDACDIYALASDGDLKAVASFSKTVYNFSTSIIAQEFRLVHRDKYGNWFVPNAVTSAASDTAAILYGLVDKSGGVASTDATFNVDNVVVLSPAGAASPGASLAAVENILRFPSANNDEVLIFRKEETSTYYAIPHPSRTDCT